MKETMMTLVVALLFILNGVYLISVKETSRSYFWIGLGVLVLAAWFYTRKRK